MAGTGGKFKVRCPACGVANLIPADREGETGKCGGCHGALPPLYLHPVPLTDRSFDSFVAHYPGPVLAEFWAPW
ncbi:MAG: thioredoxin [Geobacteraceae bacterium]|nr:MAG: thioredoxin [Geobacteraceae bacterium]